MLTITFMPRAIFGVVLLSCAAVHAAQPGVVQEEFIYTSAPFPECHASTLVETPQGLVAAWFGGTHERHPDVGIWVAHKTEAGWSAPREVANGVESPEVRYPTWNPVLFQPSSGPLMLFYKVGPEPKAWWGMLLTSTDGGHTWSKPRRLPDGILGPIKNKPIELAPGEFLSPSSSEEAGWKVHFERTTDGGETWTRSEAVNDPEKIAAIQPSLLRHGKQRLQALGRTRESGLFQIWSKDNGHTWGETTELGLPNPSSGTDAVTLADGRQLLVYNHANEYRQRSPLNVAISTDGVSWQSALELENTPGAEFSYPAVIQATDGLVHISYTWKRQRIKQVVVDPAQLILAPLPHESHAH